MRQHSMRREALTVTRLARHFGIGPDALAKITGLAPSIVAAARAGDPIALTTLTIRLRLTLSRTAPLPTRVQRLLTTVARRGLREHLRRGLTPSIYRRLDVAYTLDTLQAWHTRRATRLSA